MADQAQKVTIDGKEYAVDALNDAAKNQLMNLRVADQKIASVQQELAMLQTARNSYAKVLAENLPKE
jgi:glycerate kinase